MSDEKKKKLLKLISDDLNQIINSEAKLKGKFEATERKIERWILAAIYDEGNSKTRRDKLLQILEACTNFNEEVYLNGENLGKYLRTSRYYKSKASTVEEIDKVEDSEDAIYKQQNDFEEIIKEKTTGLVSKLKVVAYTEFSDSEQVKNYMEGASFEELVGILYVHAIASELYRIEKKPDILPGILYTKDEMEPKMDFSKQVYFIHYSEDLEKRGFWRWYANDGMPDNTISVWLDDVDPDIFGSDDMVGDLVQHYVLGDEEADLFGEYMSFIPYEGNDYLTNLRLRIGTDKKILIFVQYNENLSGFIDNLGKILPENLPEEISFAILIPDNTETPRFSDAEEIRYSPKKLTKEEMSQIFWNCCKTKESNSEVDELIGEIYKIVYNDRLLMGYIGEAYGEYYRQVGPAEALQLLKDIVSSQTEYNKIHVRKISKSEEDKKGSFIKYHSKYHLDEKQDSGRTFTQVLRNVYQMEFNKEEKNFLLLLSCLSGWGLPEEKFQQWFGIGEECFNKFKKKGWIREATIKMEAKDQENSELLWVKEEKDMYASVPVLLASTLNTEEEAKSNYMAVSRALDSFLKEVRNEDEIDMDPDVLLVVFQKLIRYLERWPYKTKDRGEHNQRIYNFEIAAIRLFVENYFYDDAYELLTEMSPKDQKKFEVKALLGIIKFRSYENRKPKYSENKELFEIEKKYFEIEKMYSVNLREGKINKDLTRENAEILFFVVDSVMDVLFWGSASYMLDRADKDKIDFFHKNWAPARNMLGGYISIYTDLYQKYGFGPSSGIIGQDPYYYAWKDSFFTSVLNLYIYSDPGHFFIAVDSYFEFIRVRRNLPDNECRKNSEVIMHLYMDEVIVRCLMSDLLAVNNEDNPLLTIRDQNLMAYRGIGGCYHNIVKEAACYWEEIVKIEKTYPLYMHKRFATYMNITYEHLMNMVDHDTKR